MPRTRCWSEEMVRRRTLSPWLVHTSERGEQAGPLTCCCLMVIFCWLVCLKDLDFASGITTQREEPPG